MRAWQAVRGYQLRLRRPWGAIWAEFNNAVAATHWAITVEAVRASNSETLSKASGVIGGTLRDAKREAEVLVRQTENEAEAAVARGRP